MTHKLHAEVGTNLCSGGVCPLPIPIFRVDSGSGMVGATIPARNSIHYMWLPYAPNTTGAHSTAVDCAPRQHKTIAAIPPAPRAMNARKRRGASARPPRPNPTAPPTPSAPAGPAAPNGTTHPRAPITAATAAARGVRAQLVPNFFPAQVAGSGTGGERSRTVWAERGSFEGCGGG